MSSSSGANSTTTSSTNDEVETVPEILMLTISECFIYKVPPLRSASGHRAEDWNLANPLSTGCLQIFQADTKLRIILYSYKDPTHLTMTPENILPLGQCPIEVKHGENITTFVDAVIDSSRYYVIRLKDPKSTRTTLIGIGFRERDQAFDFKNCLNEYVKFVDRMFLASKMASGTGGETTHKGEGSDDEGELSAKDEALLHIDSHITPIKEGEKIKVKLNVGKKSSTAATAGSDDHHHSTISTAGSGSKGGFFKPPPAPGSTVFTALPVPTATPAVAPVVAASAATEPSNSVEEEDDWGDFTSS